MSITSAISKDSLLKSGSVALFIQDPLGRTYHFENPLSIVTAAACGVSFRLRRQQPETSSDLEEQRGRRGKAKKK